MENYHKRKHLDYNNTQLSQYMVNIINNANYVNH